LLALAAAAFHSSYFTPHIDTRLHRLQRFTQVTQGAQAEARPAQHASFFCFSPTDCSLPGAGEEMRHNGEIIAEGAEFFPGMFRFRD